ncbi:MAG: thermonuclease family protein [Mesorhizobium sp.]
MSRPRRRSVARPTGMPRRGPWRVAGDFALMTGLFALLAVLVVQLDARQTRVQEGTAFVVDGDTLAVAGQRVRLRGIDAPESRQTCRKAGAEYACGRQARQALVQAIAGRRVSCSGSSLDRYGRLLGDCRAGDADLNRTQVAAGWAVAYGDFESEERGARAARLGIWAGEFERPQDWRWRHDGMDEPRHDLLAAIGGWLRAFFHLP